MPPRPVLARQFYLITRRSYGDAIAVSPVGFFPNAKRVFSSDDVFYLPGTINIS